MRADGVDVHGQYECCQTQDAHAWSPGDHGVGASTRTIALRRMGLDCRMTITRHRRIALVSIALLLALDTGRSINARVGYANPAEVWQPDPTVYADLAWPPGSDVSSALPLGARVYAQRCSVCHGPDGRGNGPAAPSMIPRPRDFTLGSFKYKSTAPGEPPGDADLEQVVAEGLPASAMPYFKDLLSPAEIRAVVQQVKEFSSILPEMRPQPNPIPPRPPTSDHRARARPLRVTGVCRLPWPRR